MASSDFQGASKHNESGHEYLKQGKYADAEREFKAAIRLNPSNGEYHNNLGIVFGAQKKNVFAEREFKKAIRLDPDRPLPHGCLGHLYRTQGKYMESEREFREAILLDSKDPLSHDGLGTLYFEQQKYQDAENEFKEAIRLDPKDTNLRTKLGILYFRQGKYFEAENELLDAIRLDPDSADQHIGLGSLYFEQKKFQDAENHFKKAIRLDPQNPLPHNGLGNLYSAQKRYDDAAFEYKVAININPRLEAPKHNLGRLYRKQKRYDEAEMQFKEAIKLDPKLTRAYIDLDYLHFEQKKYDTQKDIPALKKILFDVYNDLSSEELSSLKYFCNQHVKTEYASSSEEISHPALLALMWEAIRSLKPNFPPHSDLSHPYLLYNPFLLALSPKEVSDATTILSVDGIDLLIKAQDIDNSDGWPFQTTDEIVKGYASLVERYSVNEEVCDNATIKELIKIRENLSRVVLLGDSELAIRVLDAHFSACEVMAFSCHNDPLDVWEVITYEVAPLMKYAYLRIRDPEISSLIKFIYLKLTVIEEKVKHDEVLSKSLDSCTQLFNLFDYLKKLLRQFPVSVDIEKRTFYVGIFDLLEGNYDLDEIEILFNKNIDIYKKITHKVGKRNTKFWFDASLSVISWGLEYLIKRKLSTGRAM